MVPTIDLTVLPENVQRSARATAFVEDETIVGWRAITTSGDLCNQGCLAPGSSPHSHSEITGYLVATVSNNDGKGSLYTFGLDGICYRAAVLHKYPEEVN